MRDRLELRVAQRNPVPVRAINSGHNAVGT